MSKRLRYGVLGHPLAHSHSPALFAERFNKQSLSACSYERFERPTLEGIAEWLSQEAMNTAAPLRGLNVTIPYKRTIIPFLTELTPEAKSVGAVNAIKPTNSGWIGHNTDVEGFLKSLRPFLRSEHERALILGNGGAAAAVRHGLQSLGVEAVHITRSPVEWRAFRYADLNAVAVNHFKLIVQCTPLGTYPQTDACLPFPWEGVGPGHLVVDLVYNPAETRFLQQAKAAGAETLNGKDMLIAQAEAAWNWWNSKD